MADALYYWDGTTWKPIASGGAGGGEAGPPGPPGHSVEVFGPQVSAPAVPEKGDIWLQSPPARIVQAAPAPRTLCRRRIQYQTLSDGLTFKPGRYRPLGKRRLINGG
jgi:hypothetical protein